MTGLDAELSSRLRDLESQDLLRRLRDVGSPQGGRVLSGGRELCNFSSNDYLGLANHELLRQAMIEGVERFGTGAGASRLICGNLDPFVELEAALAAFKGTEASLCFSTGYATALGTVCALVSKGDFVVVDKLIHACLIDAARLSGATLRVFPHNDMNRLEEILQACDARHPGGAQGPRPNVLILTESVFSMDGDLAPLRDLVDLKDRFGAWLMVDEAHGTGVFGEHRRGVVEAMELSGRVDIQMGTLGKALGVSGGYIAGSRILVDWLINRARSFIFSTAPSPAVACAAKASLELVSGSEGAERQQRLWAFVNRMKESIIGAGWPLPPVRSPILPMIVGGEAAALGLSRRLQDEGFLIPAIRHPTVARGEARLRITLSASNRLEDIARLGEVLAGLRGEFGPEPVSDPDPAGDESPS